MNVSIYNLYLPLQLYTCPSPFVLLVPQKFCTRSPLRSFYFTVSQRYHYSFGPPPDPTDSTSNSIFLYFLFSFVLTFSFVSLSLSLSLHLFLYPLSLSSVPSYLAFISYSALSRFYYASVFLSPISLHRPFALPQPTPS